MIVSSNPSVLFGSICNIYLLLNCWTKSKLYLLSNLLTTGGGQNFGSLHPGAKCLSVCLSVCLSPKLQEGIQPNLLIDFLKLLSDFLTYASFKWHVQVRAFIFGFPHPETPGRNQKFPFICPFARYANC